MKMCVNSVLEILHYLSIFKRPLSHLYRSPFTNVELTKRSCFTYLHNTEKRISHNSRTNAVAFFWLVLRLSLPLSGCLSGVYVLYKLCFFFCLQAFLLILLSECVVCFVLRKVFGVTLFLCLSPFVFLLFSLFFSLSIFPSFTRLHSFAFLFCSI